LLSYKERKRGENKSGTKTRGIQAGLLCHFLVVMILTTAPHMGRRSRWHWLKQPHWKPCKYTLFSCYDGKVKLQERKQILTFLLKLRTSVYKQTSSLNLPTLNNKVSLWHCSYLQQIQPTKLCYIRFSVCFTLHEVSVMPREPCTILIIIQKRNTRSSPGICFPSLS
jgi:hypothetical protein